MSFCPEKWRPLHGVWRPAVAPPCGSARWQSIWGDRFGVQWGKGSASRFHTRPGVHRCRAPVGGVDLLPGGRRMRPLLARWQMVCAGVRDARWLVWVHGSAMCGTQSMDQSRITGACLVSER